MAEHKATITWAYTGGDFRKGKYSREHTWTFDGGTPWVSSVVLKPIVEYRAGTAPSLEQERDLHHRAHVECFISYSVKTEITVDIAR